jgi:hypothetical protein
MVGAVTSRRLSLALILPLFALGCDKMSEFHGSYEGRIIAGSFVRSCLKDDITAQLVFDPGQAISTSEDTSDEPRNQLTIKSAGQVLFDETPLDPIGLMNNDTLADFDFPGPRRLRNYMLLARPEVGPLAGRDALVVVSLLASKSVELRVIARGPVTDEPCPGEVVPEGEQPPTKAREYFGLFRMKK